MFKWLLRPIINEFKAEISKDFMKDLLIETLNDEETQKFIVEFTDTLYIRYAQKVMGTLGKMSASGIGGEEVKIPNIMNSKGQINLKGLIPMLLGSVLGKKTENTSSLP